MRYIRVFKAIKSVRFSREITLCRINYIHCNILEVSKRVLIKHNFLFDRYMFMNIDLTVQFAM